MSAFRAEITLFYVHDSHSGGERQLVRAEVTK